MDGEAGSHVAIHETFAYGAHPFYRHHFPSGNGYSSVFGSKQALISARFNASDEESSRKDKNESSQWNGFSSFQMPNGFDAMKAHFVEAEKAQTTGTSDLSLDIRNGVNITDLFSAEQRRKQSLFNNGGRTHQISIPRSEISVEEDPGSLALKLSCNGVDDMVNGLRNPKRFRSSSPGNQSPMCQVDDCHKDLKNEKDYHRRHKVCEPHSKAPQSMVQKIWQRFCQQCSRFHPLDAFDEGKRSCRRRLDGHNKRRRKTDVATNGAPLSEAGKGTDVVSIIALFSQLQAAKVKEKLDESSTEYESILQLLRKAITSSSSSLPSPISAALLQNPQGFQGDTRSNEELQQKFPSPLADLSKDSFVLLLSLLKAQLARMQTEKMPSQPLVSDQNVQALSSQGTNSHEECTRNMPPESLAFALATTVCTSNGGPDPVDLSSRPGSTVKNQGYSSLEEEDPGSSPNSMATPPENMEIKSLKVQDLFPTKCGGGFETAPASLDNGATHNSEVDIHQEDLNLSPYSVHGSDKPSQSPSDHSDCGSEQSPASSSSTGLVSNGRIIFKMCDPKCITAMTRSHESEIEQWLSLRPGCLEGYLRPGCILLTVFLSMPQHTWEELTANLRGSLRRLVHMSESDLWTKGRIIVQVGHRRALIVNGRVKKMRISRTLKAPVLRSVRPLAVVAGEEATLSVFGYNLVPETRVICVYNGRYILHKLAGSEDSTIDSLSSFSESLKEVQVCFPGGPPNVFGRCFIEVERDFMGNALPVIVANKEICLELWSLEADLDASMQWDSDQNGDLSAEFDIRKGTEALNFLHELGWIFQSTSEWFSAEAGADKNLTPCVALSRFKGVLKYAILRDWCAVVKNLLDIFFILGINEDRDVHHILSELNLVHQAVKRKCRRMIDMLLHYQPVRGQAKLKNIFTPVAGGPGGFTPLHVAASLTDAEEVIDALTEDPNEAGLQGWKSACDHSGQTPEWHARNSGKLSYIQLVEKKLLRRLSPSVRITVYDMLQSSSMLSNDLFASKIESFGSQDIVSLDISSLPKREPPSSALVCGDCRAAAKRHSHRFGKPQSRMHRPLLMMVVAVAAVCATVALLYKTGPMLNVMYSLKWEGIKYGPL
ncbi:hypothetical protein KP509_01G021200 [Ceratopteris richardii]|uniref:SBP-type domain-containing protein n=2 Tax=Ceratopteris richardii TaxID=49495 RepID=A0A8T2VES3_CERRI|nr:hypothetical protein KP509_01G021200 [Ceratopteris richardii]KAH7445711.1 hypothetical protein KP509_01G021200 [Ceratopteris richardii]KAH7445712.1 hypothetical protein KP509_01G021200 [Ceratopteris richardii]